MTSGEVWTAAVQGLSVYAVHTPGRFGMSAGLVVNAGYGDDPDEWPGVAHLAEHERTARLQSAVQGVTASTRALTEAAQTRFLIVDAADQWKTVLRQLLVILDAGAPPVGDLRAEKNAIRVELNRKLDVPAQMLAPAIAAVGWSDEDIARHDLANAEHTDELGIGQVDEFVRAKYTSDNASLVVCSPEDPGRVLDFLAEAANLRRTGTRISEPGNRPPIDPDPRLPDSVLITLDSPLIDDDIDITAQNVVGDLLWRPGGLIERAMRDTCGLITGVATLAGRRRRVSTLRFGAARDSDDVLRGWNGLLGRLNDKQLYAEIAKRAKESWTLQQFRRQTQRGLIEEFVEWLGRRAPAPHWDADLRRIDAGVARRWLDDTVGSVRFWQVTDGLPAERVVQ